MRAIHLLGACAAALLLAGCASMAPPYTTPALPVAERYPTDAPASQTGAHAAALGWRSYFADPGMQQLIARALENNRDLRITVLRVQEARAVYGIQRADSWPTVGLGVDANRARRADHRRRPVGARSSGTSSTASASTARE